MNRYRENGALAMILAASMALAGCTSMHVVGAQAGRSATAVGGSVAGVPSGWPEEVPIPQGATIDGVRCGDRYCRLWFGLMNFDQMSALRRDYLALIKDSGKWERLGWPEELYEYHVYRYTAATSSSKCGYTWEMQHGQIAGDAQHRWRVFVSLTW
ncbi:hypothetical protein ACFPN1_01320 [Lysobacter yangpyeongensis]|uniref:Lipoprotein n=1 Tax=Lysobacter yangpyeongensis TaxID=346182 RepID=A0ABW0SI59_9GAMM